MKKASTFNFLIMKSETLANISLLVNDAVLSKELKPHTSISALKTSFHANITKLKDPMTSFLEGQVFNKTLQDL
jgi:hypothetical protein